MLEVKDLVKVYKTKGGQEVRALDGITLSFEDKGMVFLLGKSGSGKSTLLNICGGLDTADTGEIIVKGRSSKDFGASDFDSYRNTYVGFIFQEYNILNEFSIEDNIALALELQGKSKDKTIIQNILKEVDLEDFAKRKPNTLSGGQKQRVAIARALIKNPEIIFADEPTGALDSETSKQVFDTLKKLSEDKLVIVVSHDREFAEEYGDRIIELKDGKVISDMQKITMSKAGKPLKNPKFEPLDSQPIQKQYDPEQTKFIKSKLPLRHALKIGLSSIKVKPIRFTFTVIMALISFCLFGLFSCLMLYNEQSVVIQSLADSDTQYLRFEKLFYSTTTSYSQNKEPDTYLFPTYTSISDEDVEWFKDKYGDGVIPVYKIMSAQIQNLTFENNTNSQELYYSNVLNAFVPASAKLEYVSGSAPKGENQIAISQFTFESIKNGKLVDISTNTQIENITSHEQLKIYIQGKAFEVSGIYKNENIAPEYKSLSQEGDLLESWNFKKSFNLYTYAVIDPECYDAFANMLGIQPYAIPQDSFSGTTIKTVYEQEQTGTVSITVYALENQTYINNDGDIAKYQSSQDDAIVLSYSTYFRVVQEIVDTLKNPLHANYSQAFVEDYKYAYDGNFEAMLTSLVQNQVPDSQNLQTYGKKVLDIVNKYIDIDSINFRILTFTRNQEVGKNVKLLGFSDNTQSINMAFMSSSLREKHKEISIANGSYQTSTSKYRPDDYQNQQYSAVLLPTNGSTRQIKDIMAIDTIINNNDVAFNLTNDLATTINGFSFILGVLTKAFLWIGIAFAVFTVLIFASFISSSITKKQKDIGILRALGARGSDVFKIFFSQSIVIALICIIGGNILTAILASVINIAMSSSLYFTLSIFVFGFASVAMIIGIAIVTSILATLFPVLKASKKKPVDSIRSI